MYDGVINVYKEPGFTSFDVVAKLRGILKQKKIGHTGTLDPDAEGVLVVCLGKATKLCEMLTDKDKSYEAVLLLGKTTDTEDISGKILETQEVTATEQQVEEAVLSFVGEYEQIPPMYSAIKVNGKKLYELARQGMEIERTPRKVVIHEIEILSIELPRVTFRVRCGKGTYIRSLCRDIGKRLGCGGVMEKLIRDSVSCPETGKSFLASEALTLEEIERKAAEGTLGEHILSIDSLFPAMPKVQVTEEGNKKLRNGNILKAKDFADNNRELNGVTRCLVYDDKGCFMAIYRYEQELHAWKADKMFI